MDPHFERLLEELGARSRAEIDQVLEAARSRAAAIEAESTHRIAQRRAAVLASCDDDLRRASDNAVAGARLDGCRGLLEAQYALVDRILTAAREVATTRLGLCVDPDHVVRRAAELVSYAGDGNVELRCRESLARHLAPALASDARVRVVAGDAEPWGLTVICDGGRLTIDDTVDAWLDGQRAAIAIDVVRAVETAP